MKFGNYLKLKNHTIYSINEKYATKTNDYEHEQKLKAQTFIALV